MKEELEKIIYDVNMSASSRIDAIINLVDKKVIGEDEEIPMENRMSDIEQVRLFTQISKAVYGRNQLRSQLREAIRDYCGGEK